MHLERMANTHRRPGFRRPLEANERKIFKRFVEGYWMRIEVLRQYEPRPIRWDSLPRPRLPEGRLPRIGIVTPSFNQATYLEPALRSILDQGYPNLHYVVQDAAPRMPARRSSPAMRAAWRTGKPPGFGQSDAISKGFARIAGQLGPNDVMAWLNSDDLLAPGPFITSGNTWQAIPAWTPSTGTD